MRRAQLGLACGFFLILAIVFTWPLVLHFRTHIYGPEGDNFLHLWGVWWLLHALATPGVGVFETDLLFAPHGVSLALNDPVPIVAGVAAVLEPFVGLVGSFNLALLLSLVIGALGALLLAREVGADAWGALAAGVVFGFSPFVMAHALGHTGYATVAAIPFVALSWIRLRGGGGWGASTALAASLVATAWTHAYFAVYALLFLSFSLGWESLSCDLSWPAGPTRSRSRVLALRLIDGLLILLLLALAALVWRGGGQLELFGRGVSVESIANPAMAFWSLLVARLFVSRGRPRLRTTVNGATLGAGLRKLALPASCDGRRDGAAAAGGRAIDRRRRLSPSRCIVPDGRCRGRSGGLLRASASASRMGLLASRLV